MQIKVRNHYEKLDLDYREVPVEIMQEYVKKEEKGLEIIIKTYTIIVVKGCTETTPTSSFSAAFSSCMSIHIYYHE